MGVGNMLFLDYLMDMGNKHSFITKASCEQLVSFLRFFSMKLLWSQLHTICCDHSISEKLLKLGPCFLLHG
jgi:hypothetical protein